MMQRLSDRGWNFSAVKYCCIFSSTKRKRNTGLTKQVCFGLEGYNGYSTDTSVLAREIF